MEVSSIRPPIVTHKNIGIVFTLCCNTELWLIDSIACTNIYSVVLPTTYSHMWGLWEWFLYRTKKTIKYKSPRFRWYYNNIYYNSDKTTQDKTITNPNSLLILKLSLSRISTCHGHIYKNKYIFTLMIKLSRKIYWHYSSV